MTRTAGRLVPTVEVWGAGDEELGDRLAAAGLSFTLDEARRIASVLGRDPTVVEAHIFNTMWSEHCSYKSSRSVLKVYLPTDAAHVILGPGEDAGVVRFYEADGTTWCAVMAHESHNHPSQVVPNEGAATGIGGIVRDVYCMGADVVGVLDPLRFGDPEGRHAERTREIVHGVVEGIWQYGNALGVPNLGGDVYFDASFDDNCLVNVVAIGLVRREDIVRSRAPAAAEKRPYDLILVGKPTDPSGFGGATFASRILDEEKALDDKYAVQVPDPFLKRMLTVATEKVTEVLRARCESMGLGGLGEAIGYKDLGAGGIACVTSELGASGGLGVRVDLSSVPVAEEGMLPEVIACSETQERYCLVVPRELSSEVIRIYNEEFELPELCHGAKAAVIGEVISEPRFVLAHEGLVVCDASTEQITAGVCYDRPRRPRIRTLEPAVMPHDLDIGEALLSILASPNVASREHVYRHYDSEVKGNCVVRPGEADAGLIAPIPGHPVGLAVSADGNPRLAALSPYEAGAAAVAEAVRNVAAIGAEPIALTDCLNFGNPEVPEVFDDFVEAVRGIGDAARGIGMKDSEAPIPIISGNVSFYNQSSAGSAILPSPIVCCMGRVNDLAMHVTTGLKRPDSVLFLVGRRYGELGGSAFLREVLGVLGSNPPRVRTDEERAAMAAVTDVIGRGLALSCHDISDGGLAVALAEMMLCAAPDEAVGAEIDVASVIAGSVGCEREGAGGRATRADLADESSAGPSQAPGRSEPIGANAQCRALFCENGGYVLEVAPGNVSEVAGIFTARGAWHAVIGHTTAQSALILRTPGGTVEVAREAMNRSWSSGATDLML